MSSESSESPHLWPAEVILPSEHLIPFSAYNVLYRDGHVPLPPLTTKVPLTC
jgi:hypothetical protein